jgi:hypothetical protein
MGVGSVVIFRSQKGATKKKKFEKYDYKRIKINYLKTTSQLPYFKVKREITGTLNIFAVPTGLLCNPEFHYGPH